MPSTYEKYMSGQNQVRMQACRNSMPAVLRRTACSVQLYTWLCHASTPTLPLRIVCTAQVAGALQRTVREYYNDLKLLRADTQVGVLGTAAAKWLAAAGSGSTLPPLSPPSFCFTYEFRYTTRCPMRSIATSGMMCRQGSGKVASPATSRPLD